MKISIYGGGCANCKKLAENARAAARELGIKYELVKVEDMAEIAKAGVMSTPALGLDGKIVAKGRVLSKDEIKELMNNK